MTEDVTQILKAVAAGDSAATTQLLAIIHDELRRIASAKLAREFGGHTLQTTALVNEAYLKLIGANNPPPEPASPNEDTPSHVADAATETKGSWNSRGHFFAAAAEAMRRILIDHARHKKRQKRGGDRQRVDFDQIDLAVDQPDVDLLALDEALDRLEAMDVTKANVVKLRYFAGLTVEQTAEATGVSVATVKRHWSYARVWLRREMEK